MKVLSQSDFASDNFGLTKYSQLSYLCSKGEAQFSK